MRWRPSWRAAFAFALTACARTSAVAPADPDVPAPASCAEDATWTAREVADACLAMGAMFEAQRDPAAAVAAYDAGLAFVPAAGLEWSNSLPRLDLSWARARALERMDRPGDALAQLRRIAPGIRMQYGDPSRELADAKAMMAGLAERTGDVVGAFTYFHDAAELYARLDGMDAATTRAMRRRATELSPGMDR